MKTAKQMLADDLARTLVDPYGPWTPATYTPAGGTGKTIYGQFNEAYVPVEDTGMELENVEATYLCMTADITGNGHGDALTVEGIAYKIAGIEPDPDTMGLMTLAYLRKA